MATLRPWGRRRVDLDPFQSTYIAHRGLFDNERDYPENTLAAFSRAVDAGYGIELDVRRTKDGKIVIAHDAGLERICGRRVAISDITYDELRRHRVLASRQRVPLLSEVLDVVAERVPLIVEIKPDLGYTQTCVRTDAELRTYSGTYCVESFDPRVLWWYRRHRPWVIRGQLSEDFSNGDGTGIRPLDWALTNMLFTPVTWPDFIAYNWEHATKSILHFWRRVLRCPLAAWAITSQAQLDRVKEDFSAFIFDGFIPDET
ncbi:MAG: hypothetical protein FWD75_09530 [Propionibacteriaceae bacterium]|nr:hypothetical protein [Propionibacteriaceae bacterium]